MRERNNILVMHRTATRRSNLTPAEIASRVHGVDAQYMKDPENPNIAEKLGVPGLFPTNMNFPEEKFKLHAARNTAYVSMPPRGFGINTHLQYSFFTDKKFPVFDEVFQATRVIERIQNESANPSVPTQSMPDHPFVSYLIRHVHRLDDRVSHQWMTELASGKKTIAELVQTYGVPFKQWRPVPNVSKCPLLEYVARYRPGFAEATWFIRINVIYVEMNEIKRDSTIRQGDWFHNPRRAFRRALGWTEQLVDYMHAIARQSGKTIKKVVEGHTAGAMVGVQATQEQLPVKNHLHGEVGMSIGLAGPQLSPAPGSTLPPVQQSFHEKWSYALKLSEYQFKMGLLDRTRYFDGLLSLLQKCLSPRARGGVQSAILQLGVNEISELVTVVQNLLPELLLYADGTVLLVKTLLQHLRHLLPPGTKLSQKEVKLGSSLQEELVVAMCQMLRDTLLNSHDVLVRLDENGPQTWPPYVLSSRFFDRSAYGPAEIDDYLVRCHRRAVEVSGRILRLQQVGSGGGPHGLTRNEAHVLQCLDRFHRIDATVDLAKLYEEVFASLPSTAVDVPVDIAAIFLVCEWAVTAHRPAEYRYLTAVSLFELHNKNLVAFGKEQGIISCRVSAYQMMLQSALQSFLEKYQPKVITELNQLIDMYCSFVRRRLFSMEKFVDFAAVVIEVSATETPPPALTPVMSPPNANARAPSGPSSSANSTSAMVTSTAYNIECAPGRGYKSSDIPKLTTAERLRLYLWQLPRGPFPLPTSLPMIPTEDYDGELALLRWLDVLELRREHLAYSKTLERAQSLCVYVFHTHGEVNDPSDPSNKDRVMKEVDYLGKVGDLVSAVKTMCGHDKGRFTLWFLKNIYDTESSFFRFSELGSVEHIVKLVCLVLEIVDILALMEVLIFFLRHSPVFLVKNVVLPLIERHEITLCATGQILMLMQTFVDRFKGLSKALADDKAGSVAKFFCKLYYGHIKQKEVAKLDLPIPLLHPIAQTARKNQEGNQKQKEMALEVANPPARIPTPKESIPPEVKSALARSFKTLRGGSGAGGDGKQPAVGTPLASPESQNSGSSSDAAYESPMYSSLVWSEIVAEATEVADSKSRDGAVDYAAAAINSSMAGPVGAAATVGANARGRAPNYVFFLRAVMSEVMDKWMASIMARTKNNYRRPMATPHYVHRCVRLIREIMEQHPEGEDFQEKFSNTLVMWLQKEVIPGFAGSDTPKRVRNPFINLENGKEAFVMNQKGRLDKLQYGLKAFLVSLTTHKVLDLTQILRFVLVPLFPRLRRGREPPPNLPTQLLAMALVFQLFSDPPQNLMLDPQKIVLFDEPVTKYHFRYMRTQVPVCLMFPLVHLLCQISYQMEENSAALRPREERGTMASCALFNLTSDLIVREIIFHDTKEAKEKLQPVFYTKSWHTAVLMTHFFRPPNSQAEYAPGQVRLLKVEQIMDQMNVWTLNRGGSIYLDLQMSRQQQRAKRTTRASIRLSGSKRKAASQEDKNRPSKRGKDSSGSAMNGSKKHDEEEVCGYLDAEESDEEDIDFDVEETSSATETLANTIVLRALRKSSRPSPVQHNATVLCTVSSISTPHLFTPNNPAIGSLANDTPHQVLQQLSLNPATTIGHHHVSELTPVEVAAAVAKHEAQEAVAASLYTAIVCNIPRRAMGSVITKMLQVLEDDVKASVGGDNQPGRKINGTTVVRLLCGVIRTPSAAAFLLPYMMSLATQLETMYEACVSYDDEVNGGRSPTISVRRLRRQLAIRLQLVGVIKQSKLVAPTICYRNRMVKALFYLLSTTTTNRGAGLSLFSWILDLVPVVNAGVLHDKQFELVNSLDLPAELQWRVWTVFPRPANGATAVHVRDAQTQGLSPVDPWGLMEHVTNLPSDDVIAPAQVNTSKRRRVFRCV